MLVWGVRPATKPLADAAWHCAGQAASSVGLVSGAPACATFAAAWANCAVLSFRAVPHPVGECLATLLMQAELVAERPDGGQEIGMILAMSVVLVGIIYDIKAEIAQGYKV